MIKYDSTLVTFTEVPDEISLCINCTCCPLHCKGCFEPWLREDRGEPLTIKVLDKLINDNPHISCVCFMGGINNYPYLSILLSYIHERGLKTALYSGHDFMEDTVAAHLDYYKYGHYDAARGPLNKVTTNQKFMKKERNYWKDITYRFQQKKD